MKIKIQALSEFKKGLNLSQKQKLNECLDFFSHYYENIPEDNVAKIYIERCEETIKSAWDRKNGMELVLY